MDPVELSKLRSLGEVIGKLGATPAVADVPAPVPAAAGIDLSGVVLEIVADKTGYPVDMLEPCMELEADLGIDSIKRVEILSAVRRAVPDLPEVDPVELSKLRSLGEVIGKLGAAGAVVEAPAPVAIPAPAPVAPTVDLSGVVLSIVADKTGYPVDMLEPCMELEADLGIDSIKRVEILSAVRRAVPDLPEVDPVELSKLRSLGEVISQLGTVNEPAPEAPVQDALGRRAVRVVPATAPGFALAGLHNGRIVVTDDGGGIAAHVVARLGTHGISAQVCTTVPADAHGVIFLGGLAEVASVDAALAVQKEAFGVARTVAEHRTEHGGVFVTVQDTGGDFGSRGS
ncbi:MAG: hypothetical protein E6G35_04380, partial [Actinobacteria bacterium]